MLLVSTEVRCLLAAFVRAGCSYGGGVQDITIKDRSLFAKVLRAVLSQLGLLFQGQSPFSQVFRGLGPLRFPTGCRGRLETLSASGKFSHDFHLRQDS